RGKRQSWPAKALVLACPSAPSEKYVPKERRQSARNCHRFAASTMLASSPPELALELGRILLQSRDQVVSCGRCRNVPSSDDPLRTLVFSVELAIRNVVRTERRTLQGHTGKNASCS